MRMVSLIRGAIVVAVIVAIGVSVAYLPWWKEFLLSIPEQVKEEGIWGPFLLGLVYIIASLMFVPGSILTMGAGYALGLGAGMVTVSVASVIAATLGFLLSRLLIRGWLYDSINQRSRLRVLDGVIRQQGFKIVLLLRLSPVFPFSLLNYSLGMTSIARRDFVLATWIGMLPATAMYTYLGTTIHNLAAELTGEMKAEPFHELAFLAGLAVTVLVTCLLSLLARRALREAAMLAASRG